MVTFAYVCARALASGDFRHQQTHDPTYEQFLLKTEREIMIAKGWQDSFLNKTIFIPHIKIDASEQNALQQIRAQASSQLTKNETHIPKNTVIKILFS